MSEPRKHHPKLHQSNTSSMPMKNIRSTWTTLREIGKAFAISHHLSEVAWFQAKLMHLPTSKWSKGSSPDFRGKSCRKSWNLRLQSHHFIVFLLRTNLWGKAYERFSTLFVKEASWTINLLFYNHHTQSSHQLVIQSQIIIDHKSFIFPNPLPKSSHLPKSPLRALTFGRASDSDMGLPCKQKWFISVTPVGRYRKKRSATGKPMRVPQSSEVYTILIEDAIRILSME